MPFGEPVYAMAPGHRRTGNRLTRVMRRVFMQRVTGAAARLEAILVGYP